MGKTQFSEIIKALKAVPDDAEDKVAVATDSIYEIIAVEAKREIWAAEIRPISEKVKTNPSLITLIETEQYVDAIGAYGRGRNRYVGLPASGIHKESGLPWHKLFEYLYAYGRRPHIITAANKVLGSGKLRVELKKQGFKVE
ncbi:hypothetical protein KAU11_10165 [Candidatus Babeliales bacterium]|nr:hypothetical protein [Candidatus Babeliales bacterium]